MAFFWFARKIHSQPCDLHCHDLVMVGLGLFSLGSLMTVLEMALGRIEGLCGSLNFSALLSNLTLTLTLYW